MDNKAESENIGVLNQLESRSVRIWNSIKNFGRKPPETQIAQPSIPEPLKITEVPETEKDVDLVREQSSVEDHQEEPLVAEEIKGSEKLRPVPKIFFHTTPTNNVDQIKKDGLLGVGQYSTLSSNVGYSLYFAEEHQHRLQDDSYRDKKMAEKLAELSDDYTMTIWTDNEGIKKANSIEYKIKHKTEDDEPDSIKADTRQLSAEHMIATVPLDRETREEILKQMILSEKGIVTADEIEQKLAALLKNKNMWNADEETRSDTIHGIVTTIEHSLIKGAVTKRIEALKKKEGGFSQIKDALQATVMLEGMINDPVSARYLESAKKFLTEQLTESSEDSEAEIDKITQKTTMMKENPNRTGMKFFSLLDPRYQIEFWGSSTTEYAKYLLAKQMGYG